MIELVKKLYKEFLGDSAYKKNIALLVGGRIISQSIPILLTPWVARIYSPKEFGVFAVFSSIVAILSMMSNGRYNLAIVLPKDKIKAQKVSLTSSLLTILFSLLMIPLFILIGERTLTIFNMQDFYSYSYLIVITILIVGLYESLFYYALRTKEYKTLSANVILQALVMISVRIVLGLLGYTGLGLIISYLSGYAISYIFLLFMLRKTFLLGEDNMFKKFNIGKILKRYKKFPLLSLPADLLSTVTSWWPNIFMNNFFGSEYTGYFSMTEKVLGSPIWFITSSVGDVFKQEASEQYREKGTCLPIFKKTTKSLFLLGLLPFAIIFLVAPYAVPFLLGDGWEPVGKYIRILSFMYFIRFIVNPVGYVIYIVEKQNWAIIFQTVMALCTVGSFFLGWYMEDIYITFWAWVISSSIVNIGLYFLLYKLASKTKNVTKSKK